MSRAEDMFSSGRAWEAYEAVELDMVRVVEFIPLEFHQLETASFRLLNVILAACSQIDSVFKGLFRHLKQDSTIGVALTRARVSNILDYAEVFQPIYYLSILSVGVVRMGEGLTPFAQFGAKDKAARSPDWWQAYNGLKHDFYGNALQANLGNALNSLAALFLLNSLPPQWRFLERLGVLSPPRRLLSLPGEEQDSHVRSQLFAVHWPAGFFQRLWLPKGAGPQG